MAFVRILDKKRIERLLDQNTYEGNVFSTVLIPRIMTGQIFMAIRDDKVDFYVGGNCFMSYSGQSFKVNPKIFGKSNINAMVSVASVLPVDWTDKVDDLVRQCYDYCSDNSEQTERKIIQAYFPVYDNMKEKVLVLDREIRINDGNGKKSDWLLYNADTCQLKFVEVKTGSNKALKKHRDGTFDVSEQLDIYSRQYEKYGTEIVKQYGNYIEILNKLLGLDYKVPVGLLDTKAGLAIFVDDQEPDKELIRLENPFITTYVPSVSATLADIWNHFAGHSSII